jgi:hypothetical protein
LVITKTELPERTEIMLIFWRKNDPNEEATEKSLHGSATIQSVKVCHSLTVKKDSTT